MSINALSGSMGAAGSVSGSTLTQQTAQSGQLQGMAVECDDNPLDALADSAEELTFARDNSRQTKLADRKQKMTRVLTEENLKRVLKAQESVNNADSAAMNKVLEYYRFKANRSAQQLLSDLAELGSHSASAWAFLLNSAEKEQDPELKSFLKEAADLLYAEKEPEIAAVVNSIGVLEGQSLAPAFELSKSYSEIASGDHDPQQILSYLNKKFVPAELQQGIDLMFKALAADLAAATPSHETSVLNDLASCLGKTRVINAAVRQVNNFADRISSVLQFDHQLQSGSLLDKMLQLSRGRFVTAPQVHQLYRGDIKTKNPEDDVLAAQEFMRLVRNLPLELFDGDEQRSHLMDGTQKLIDDLIDKEDAWLDAGGA